MPICLRLFSAIVAGRRAFMPNKKHIIVGLGELLWDLFPQGKQLGGAPANFAYITNLLGDHGIPASRVGNDSLGDEAIRKLSELGVNAESVQRDGVYPTGVVNVEFDARGQPQYEIAQPVAWDFLEWTPAWQQLAREADAVCFGSLAQRSAPARATILRFVRATRPEALRIFDVNLRQKFYSREVLTESLQFADIVKLNHEELPTIMRLFDLDNRGEKDSARCLLSLYDLKLVCMTQGANGSLLMSPTECNQHPGFPVANANPVGAGDAFTAALVNGFLRGMTLAQINENANRVGAWVAGEPGAMPTPPARGLMKTLATIG